MFANGFHLTRERRFARRSDGAVDEYAYLAPIYDRRWSAYVGATVGHSLRRLPDGAWHDVLDVGCGTGALLTAMAARFPEARLLGVDLSSAMLTAARVKLPSTAILCRGRAEALPFEAERFDLAVSSSAFHDFDDLGAAMRELCRVLRPGGAVFVTDWCADFLTTKLFARLAKLRRGADFSVPDSRRWRVLLDSAGFRDVVLERYRAGRLWGLMSAVAVKGGRAA